MIQITPIEFILSMPKNKAHSIFSKKKFTHSPCVQPPTITK